MKIVLGIGNHGDLYKDTRHNSGYMAIDLIADDFNISMSRQAYKSMYGKGKIFDEDVLLLKPLTYVNLSGEALIEAMNFYKVGKEDIIIIVDDMDTEPGLVRLKKKGSSAGHNGLKNIIEHIHSEEFDRIKIGIGRPDHSSNPNRIPDYVLSSPKDREVYEAWKDGISRGAEALEYSLKENFEKAMTKYNSMPYQKKEVIIHTISFKK